MEMAVLLLLGGLALVEARLALDQVPAAISSRKQVSFAYSCEGKGRDEELCLVQAIVDEGVPFTPAATTFTVVAEEEGHHFLELQLLSPGGSMLESVEYSWEVDTIPPETHIDTGPGSPDHGTEADDTAFEFFTFHCSEPPCTYRYHFDYTRQLYAEVKPAGGGGFDLDGQVSLMFVDESGAYAGSAPAGKGWSAAEDAVEGELPEVPEAEEEPGSVGVKGEKAEAKEDSPQEGSKMDVSVFIDVANDPPIRAELLPSLIVIYDELEPSHRMSASLGAAELVPISGHMVFSVTAEETLPWLITRESRLIAELQTNTSMVVGSGYFIEPRTTKEWVRTPELSVSEGSHRHVFEITSIDAAGNEDPTPARLEWQPDNGPKGYLSSAPPVYSAVNTAVFVLLCESSTSQDCYVLYSLDQGPWEVVSEDSQGELTVELDGLSDGWHEVAVFACEKEKALDGDASSSGQGLLDFDCIFPDRPAPAYSWEVDTSHPQVSIVEYPSTLLPSRFVFAASKPNCAFACAIDGMSLRPCNARSSFELGDGSHTISVTAIDPAGRSDQEPQEYEWQVSMLDTSVSYCPAGIVPQQGVDFKVEPLYNGVPCIDSKRLCTITYELSRTSVAACSDQDQKEDSLPEPLYNCSHTADENCTVIQYPIKQEGEDEGCVVTTVERGRLLPQEAKLALSDLEEGSYKILLSAQDQFGNLDSSPAECNWEIVTDATKFPRVELVATPPSLLHKDYPVLFFEVAASAYSSRIREWRSIKPSRTSKEEGGGGIGLTYVLKGPGSDGKARSVPITEAHAWKREIDERVQAGETALSSESQGDAAFLGMVWGIKLEGLRDGNYMLQVYDEESGASVSFSWEISTVPPTLTLVDGPQAVSHSPRANITYGCSVDDCMLLYKLDDQEEWSDDQEEWSNADGLSVILSDLTAGNHTLSAVPRDVTGFQGVPIQFKWTVDPTRVETLVTTRPSVITDESVARFSFACELEGRTPRQGCTYEYQLLKLRESDLAALTEPRVGSGIVYRGDRSVWLPTAQSVEFKNFDEGIHLLRVRGQARGMSNSEDLIPAEVVWRRDATPPIVEWASKPELVSHVATAQFHVLCRDAESHPAADTCKFFASLDGKHEESVSDFITLFDLSEGTHTFTLRAEDAAGNSGKPLAYQWRINLSKPDTLFLSMPHAATSATSAYFLLEDTVNVKRDEHGQKQGYFQYQLDKEPSSDEWSFSMNGASLTFHDIGEGDHTLRVRAVTGIDRDEMPLEYKWTVDTTCPDTSIAVYPTVLTHLKTAVLVAKATGTDTMSFQYQLDPAAGDPGLDWVTVPDSSGVVNLNDLSQGMHVIHMRAVDAAGNVDPSPKTYAWIVDRDGPSSGHPSRPMAVRAQGSDGQARVEWHAPLDDGGGVVEKYRVSATTAYTDISVEAITTVAGDGVNPPATSTVMSGLTNGQVYSFEVVATNAFGGSEPSLTSNRVLLYDPSDPCGLVMCNGNGSCFPQENPIGELLGFCLCRPGFEGPSCNIMTSVQQNQAFYPSAWEACSQNCGGGVRSRKLTCAMYHQGAPVASMADNDECLTGKEGEQEQQPSTEGICRDVPCGARFLSVAMNIKAFHSDAFFSVASQDAFFHGFALEVAQALHIDKSRIQDLNAVALEHSDEFTVSFIIGPGGPEEGQPIEMVEKQLHLQISSNSSAFRSHGTWSRLVDPESMTAAVMMYDMPEMTMKTITFNIIALLVITGTGFLLCASYGAWIAKANKWDDRTSQNNSSDNLRSSDSWLDWDSDSESDDDDDESAASCFSLLCLRSGRMQLESDEQLHDDEPLDDDESAIELPSAESRKPFRYLQGLL
ncbi:unnamed protein product [Chrysoparadoxa australica]